MFIYFLLYTDVTNGYCLLFLVPNPPRNLTAIKVTNSSIYIRWLPPIDSLYSGYTLRYRTNANSTWVEQTLPNSLTEKKIDNLVPGEKYIIRVNSVSYRAEPTKLQQIIQTVRKCSL